MIKNYFFQDPSLQPKSIGNANLPKTQTVAHPSGHQSTFYFDTSKDEIIFYTEIVEPKTKAKLLGHPEWFFHDHFVLLLDPKHDHMHQYLIAINKDGSQVSSVQIALPGEELTDRLVRNLSNENFTFKKELNLSQNGWNAKLTIPLNSLGLTAMPAVMGVKVKFGFEDEIIYDAVTWPMTSFEFDDLPMAYGNLQINPDIVVDSVDFGTPYWKTGDIGINLKIEGKTTKSNLIASITTSNVLGKTESYQKEITQSANGNFSFSGLVDVHFANKWAPDFIKTSRVTIEIKDGNQTLWNSTYPIGFDAGIIAREPFGKFKRDKHTRPNKSDPNFLDNFRCWLFSKLPDWQYQTTRDKAPSDFYLKDNSGKFNLNLMDLNSLEQIADYIKSEFSDWQDGLCAAAMIFHHPFLSRHSGSWAGIAGKSHVTTVLRMGGCFCGDNGRISAHISELLGARYGVKLKGFSLGLRGHLTGLVESPIGEVLIDPMLGICYHTLDNARLATLQEMREDQRIHQRVWLLAYSNGHEFFINTHNQLKKPYKIGDSHYPGF
jgi:hypothetical protein